MKTNAAGRALIRAHEKLRLTAYFDGVPNKRWPHGTPTIGWGHTGDVTADDVVNKRTITAHAADAIFDLDVDTFERGIVDLLDGAQLTDDQFSAVVSLTFNIGIENLRTSHLLAYLKAGDCARAADEFPKWNHSGGKVLAELTRRRAEERSLFLGA